MNAVLRVAAVGRGTAGWLAVGLAVTLVSAGCLVALSVGSASLAVPAGSGASVAAALALPALVRALGVGRVVLRYIERMVTHAATFRFLAALRVWLFRALAQSSAGGLGAMRSGDALSRIVSDVEALDGLYMRIALPGIAAVLLLPVLVWVVSASGVLPALAVGGLYLLAAIVLPMLAARSTREQGLHLAEMSADLRTAALDTVTGLREVLAYGAQGRMLALVQAKEAALVAAQRVIAQRAALAQAGAFLCGQAALLVVLGAGPAGLVLSVFLCLAAFELVSGMPRAGVLAGHAVGAAQRIVAVADQRPAVAEPATPAPLPSGTGLRFEAVQFRWLPDRPPVLDGLTLDVPAGSRVAILGPSGAGKSTLVSLALKVVSPQAGRVLLGGTNLAALSASDVRSRMAWLGQTTHVFRDTVRANLLLGRPDASDSQVWDALDQAQVASRIRALPGGLDAVLAPSGLSGGEARRVALARTLLSPAPILLLDEPTAGLDAATEMAFYQTLNTVAAGRTVVLIVHRLTGVEHLDRIWRLSAGRAVAAAA